MHSKLLTGILMLFGFTLTIHAQKKITTVEELAAINADAASLKGRYELTNDLTVENWIPIGTPEEPFLGTFDGKGHTITIKSMGKVASTPFKMKSGIEIPAIETLYVGIFGFNGRRSVIKNLHVTGDIIFERENENIMLGGITGANYGSVFNCISETQLLAKGQGTLGYCFAGGLTGINNGIVRNNYSTGNITVEGGSCKYVGGIAGLNDFDEGIIQWCYATGNISATGGNIEQYAGGIAGLCVRGGLVQYCVSLNENILSDKSENSFTGRYVGHNLGRTGNNFSRRDITLTNDMTKPNANDLIEYTSLSEIEWWTINRHIRFQFGQSESKPWAWNLETNLPVLHWEPGAESENIAVVREKKASNTIEIRTAEELELIGKEAFRLKRNYMLMDDITVDNWKPIGHAKARFEGSFDGNGHTITINGISSETKSVSRPYHFTMAGGNVNTAMIQTYFIGLFGSTSSSAVVQNLNVTGIIEFDSGLKSNVVGGIVGENLGIIKNCKSSISTTAFGGVLSKKLKNFFAFAGGCYAGGIVGINNGVVWDSYAIGNVSVSSDGVRCAGGIAGSNGYQHDTPTGKEILFNIGFIENCYTTSSISISGTGTARYVGGIAGILIGIAPSISIGGETYSRSSKYNSTVKGCVALNEIITIDGEVKNKGLIKQDHIGHIIGETQGSSIQNFARRDMQFNMSSDKLKRSTLISHEETWNKDWWVGTSGPGKKNILTFLLDATIENDFKYSFGSDEDAPWVWDEELKRPVLYWETDIFTHKNTESVESKVEEN